MMKQSKSDLIGGNATYFSSEGMYYSYGNKGNYDMVNNSSVVKYPNRSYVKNPLKTELSHFNAVMMEEMVSNELSAGLIGMFRIIPNIRTLITPIMNTTFSLQEEKIDVDLKKVPSSEDGLW